jgi:hypothetical protein
MHTSYEAIKRASQRLHPSRNETTTESTEHDKNNKENKQCPEMKGKQHQSMDRV